MLSFVTQGGLALIAVVLATTGAAHLADLPAFARLLRGHELLPRGLALPAALVAGLVECLVAASAVAALAGSGPRFATFAFAAALMAGVGFLAYLRSLLRSGHTGSCGCTPLASPLTPASFVPAGSLATTGFLGLGAIWLAGGGPAVSIQVVPATPWGALAVAWGAALAGLILLLPATAPGRVGRATP